MYNVQYNEQDLSIPRIEFETDFKIKLKYREIEWNVRWRMWEWHK